MKLSISNIAWDKSNDQKMYFYLNKLGFDAIEIAPTRIFPDKPYDNLNGAYNFSNLLYRKYNLRISSMQSIWYGHNELLFGSESDRKILIDYTKKAIDFAKYLNCKNLVFGSPKNRIRNNKDINIAIKFLEEIGDYAEKSHVVFAIEANPVIYNTDFINTTKEALDLVKVVNSKGIKVNLDIGTMIYNKENLKVLIKDIYLINHVHISEPYLEVIKKRNMHYILKKILKREGYDKYISLEVKKVKDIRILFEKLEYMAEVFG